LDIQIDFLNTFTEFCVSTPSLL